MRTATVNEPGLPDPETVALTVKIAAAYVSNNTLSVSELPAMLAAIHRALTGATAPAPAPEIEKPVPVVPVKKSVTPDYLVCLEDGKKLKMLKRHLATSYGMTPDDYRAKWGLPADYPMVAPNYAAERSKLAKAIGLGQKAAPASAPEPTRKLGRPRKAKPDQAA